MYLNVSTKSICFMSGMALMFFTSMNTFAEDLTEVSHFFERVKVALKEAKKREEKGYDSLKSYKVAGFSIKNYNPSSRFVLGDPLAIEVQFVKLGKDKNHQWKCLPVMKYKNIATNEYGEVIAKPGDIYPGYVSDGKCDE